MKYLLITSILLFMLVQCKQKDNAKAISNATNIGSDSAAERPAYFPLTNYIKGQLLEIKNSGINPLKYTTINNKKDSAWVKVEEMDNVFAEYIQPEIDSARLAPYFTEKKFFDQTLNAITLTYDPVKQLPDSFQLQHLDVYIEPENNIVQRIYMVKKLANGKLRQLTWHSGKSARAITVFEDAAGKVVTEDEVLIKWKF